MQKTSCTLREGGSMKKQISWGCLLALCIVLALPAMAEDYPHPLPWDDWVFLSTNDPIGTYKEAPVPFFDNDDVNVSGDMACFGSEQATATFFGKVVMSSTDHEWEIERGDPRIYFDFDESSDDRNDYMAVWWTEHSGPACSGQLTVDIVSN
jgi:hypothetical protein